MSADDVIEKIASSAGGAFRFGRGIVSRSAIVLFVVEAAVGVTAYGLEGLLRLSALVFGGVLFLIWYFASLYFTTRHPEIALLDGAEWTAWERFKAEAKGLPPQPRSQAELTTRPPLELPSSPDEDAGE